ncbi:hypothetical protein LPTSP4_23460 [Leptospira ryugenii]|uniref:Uncharacterized protein n=1 Tax=Leptospira ryugenii TaxID=1917863 RepID=A0A2P2E1R7_9LEPT|nr:GldG family protein [Leptospira ryugenii]GBF50819.1 hypothetical protein LPTSP4_23460 [Leptospira ryugenii]
MKFPLKYFFLVQIVLFFILSNLLVSKLSCRTDISNSVRFEFSKSTENRIQDLQSPLFIDAYFSSDLPPEYSTRMELIQFYLGELRKLNPDFIKIKFLDPSSSPEIRKQASEVGLIANEIQNNVGSSKSIREAYMGIVIRYRNESFPISDFFFVEEAEEKIMRVLRKFDQRRIGQQIGIIVDRGCLDFPVPGNGSGINTWGVFFHQVFVEEYGPPQFIALNDQEISPEIKLLLIIGSPNWSEVGKRRLDAFLASGGRLVFFANSIKFNLKTSRDRDGLKFYGSTLAYPEQGYATWSDQFAHYGFRIEPSLLFNLNRPVLISQSSQEIKKYYPLWHYLYKEEGNFHQNHLLTLNSNLLLVPWVSVMQIDLSFQVGMKSETILYSDLQIMKKSNVFQLDQLNQFSENEIIRNRIPLGVLTKGKINPYFSGTKSLVETEIFTLSSGHLISDILSLPEFRSVYKSSNVSFMLNLIDYMLGETDFILSRNKKIVASPLNLFSPRERIIYSSFNVILLPFLMILLVIRYLYKRQLGKIE